MNRDTANPVHRSGQLDKTALRRLGELSGQENYWLGGDLSYRSEVGIATVGTQDVPPSLPTIPVRVGAWLPLWTNPFGPVGPAWSPLLNNLPAPVWASSTATAGTPVFAGQTTPTWLGNSAGGFCWQPDIADIPTPKWLGGLGNPFPAGLPVWDGTRPITGTSGVPVDYYPGWTQYSDGATDTETDLATTWVEDVNEQLGVPIQLYGGATPAATPYTGTYTGSNTVYLIAQPTPKDDPLATGGSPTQAGTAGDLPAAPKGPIDDYLGRDLTYRSVVSAIGPGMITNTMLVNSTFTVTAGTNLTGGGTAALGGALTLNCPTFVASGASHAAGAVPDPGSIAGTTKFLREDATWQVPAGGGTQHNPVVRIYTANDTWTKPANLDYIETWVKGGGGGGASGGTAGVGQASAGGGGGSGGLAYKKIAAASLAATESVTVGAAGTGGTVGGLGGGAGGNSQFSGTLLVKGNGGAGGLTGNAGVTALIVNGGAGGAASGGDINAPGAPGHPGMRIDGTDIAPGTGGSSEYGGGGFSPASSIPPAGNFGTGRGAGGSGGGSLNNDGGNAGGDGTAGIVIVREFYTQ